ncbi:MAG: pyridoxamine 5'-phosphate oxidase family protein [Dehalococcoidia bacterium]
MGFRDLSPAQAHALLERERVIRIAFTEGDDRFLVPLFYVFHAGALYGLTTNGRKTALARANPAVAFQVDSTATTGPYAWESVAGQGVWAEVTDDAAIMAFVPLIQAKLADSPLWAQRLLAQRLATLGRVAWSITPTALSGRAHEPD